MAHNGSMDRPGSVIADYIADLEQALSGPARARRNLVAEAHVHLLDATDAYEHAGWTRRDAERQAVEDFGPVKQVAEGFQDVLAVSSSRRSALTLLVMLLPQAFLWDKGLGLAAQSSPVDTMLAGFLNWFIGWFGFAALVAAAATLLISGLGQRWVRPGAWLPLWTGAAVAVGAVGTLVMGVSLLLLGNPQPSPLWLFVLVLMVLPMVWTARSAVQCLGTAGFRHEYSSGT